jgi:5-methylthioadenosine/S-adenosylhomocysteine deaminase
MRATSLITNVTVVTMGPRREIIEDGAVAWTGSRIVAVGKSDQLRREFAAAVPFDGGGRLLCPGFVDAHNHSAHFLTKGLLDDVALPERWKTRLYPFECSVSQEETYWGAMGTYAEQLLHGTTCVGDPGSAYPGAVARAAQDSGMRLVLSGTITDTFDPARPIQGLGEVTADSIAQYNERLYEEFDGAADGRIRVAFGLWSGSTVSDDLCIKIRDAAERRDAIIHGHLSTREADNAESLRRYGCSEVERYRRLGVLGPRFVGAHAGAISAVDVELLAVSGASIIHCPSASMLGGFGCIAHGRFPELAAAQVNLAIGSDAASISRTLDMPRLMYLAACAHKDARRDSTVMGAHRALEMATIGGARALGLDDLIGSIEEGKQADFVLLRTDGIEWEPRPSFNPVANLVYSSGGYRADTVVVAGRTVVSHGDLQTQSLCELIPQVRAAAMASVLRAGLPEESAWPIV